MGLCVPGRLLPSLRVSCLRGVFLPILLLGSSETQSVAFLSVFSQYTAL